MSAKISAARRAHFLKIVAETGNQTIAVERAKVSRSWVTLHRATDPAFDAAVREALAESQRVLRDASSTGSAAPQDERNRARKYHQGHELIVRGTRSGPAGTKRRIVQIGRARVKQWTASAERRFLIVLGETANVKAACAAVGLSPASVYNHRNRWPDFARRWREVLDETVVRLDFALVERGGNFLAGREAPSGGPIREMTVSEAIWVVEMHKRRQAREPDAPGRWRRPKGLDAVRPGIIRKLQAIENARARGWLP